MKILSLLLVLALGLGAAWWTQANPGGSLDDARRDADRLADRAGDVLERARVEAVDALGLTIGRDTPEPATPAPADDAAGAAAPDALADTDGDVVAAATDPADADAPIAGAPVPSDPVADTAPAAPDVVPAAIADVVARLETIETRLSGDADSAATNADTAPQRLAALEERLDDAERRERDALERLDTIDERLLTFADRLDTLGTTRLARAMPAGDDVVVPADDAIGTDDGEATDDASGVAGAGADTFAEDVPDDPLASRIDSLAAGLDRRLARLEGQSTAANAGVARLDALSARIDALATSDTSVDDAQAEILTELAVLDGQVSDDVTREDAPMLGEALESTRSRLEALEARVRAMPESSAGADAAKTTQSALEAQVAALAARLEALPGVDPAITSSIDAVRDQVDALESRGFVTQDELRARTEGRDVEYKIYFDANDTEISEAAARVLDSFIVQEQNRTTGVSIFGFTDRRGSASYNQRLALERATNVRSYLIRNGLPYTKIRTLSGLGEDAAAAVLPDDADDAQQRVVVLFAAQP